MSPLPSTLTRMRRARSERRMRYGMDIAAEEPRTPTGVLSMALMAETRVPLPAGVREPFTVYVNGVKQELGHDYRVAEGRLVFTRELVKEGNSGLLAVVPRRMGYRYLQAQRPGRCRVGRGWLPSCRARTGHRTHSTENRPLAARSCLRPGPPMTTVGWPATTSPTPASTTPCSGSVRCRCWAEPSRGSARWPTTRTARRPTSSRSSSPTRRSRRTCCATPTAPPTPARSAPARSARRSRCSAAARSSGSRSRPRPTAS